MIKQSIKLLPLLCFLVLQGCATYRLRTTTVAESSSVTDINYDMVLKNVIQQRVEKWSLPWAMEITSGSIAVNDTGGATAGYSETKQAVTPSVGFNGMRAVQQSWATVPVTNQVALLRLQSYYEDASQNLPVKLKSYQSSDQIQIETTTVGIAPPTVKKIETITTPQSNAEEEVALTQIDTKCFQFCPPGKSPPPNSYHATFKGKSVWVDKDNESDMESFTKFTILILGTIDQIPPKSPSAAPNIGSAQPLQLLE